MKRKEFCVRLLMPSLVIATVTAGGCGKQEAPREAEKQVVALDPADNTESAESTKADGKAGQEAEADMNDASDEDADMNDDPTAGQEDNGSSEAETEKESGRKDGERFEDTIILEGMEETVRYEHVINQELGFEIDYDYESFERRSGSDSERFISLYDDMGNPENYLEVTCSTDDAETAAAVIGEELSKEYTITKSPYPLENAGDCIRIDASETKEGGYMPDQLQVVYIIPAGDGCRIATAHYAIEAAEGFGRRFAYIMNTLVVIEK